MTAEFIQFDDLGAERNQFAEDRDFGQLVFELAPRVFSAM